MGWGRGGVVGHTLTFSDGVTNVDTPFVSDSCITINPHFPQSLSSYFRGIPIIYIIDRISYIMSVESSG